MSFVHTTIFLWLLHNWSRAGTKTIMRKKNYKLLKCNLILDPAHTPDYWLIYDKVTTQRPKITIKDWPREGPSSSGGMALTNTLVPLGMDLNSPNNSWVPVTWFTRQCTRSQKPRIKVLALLLVLGQSQLHHSSLHLKRMRQIVSIT